MKSPAPPWQPWPVAIMVWFAAFLLFITGFIIFAVRQKMDLVRPDYYDAEIRFQRDLDRKNATQAVQSKVAVDYQVAEQTVTVKLPVPPAIGLISGTIHFYRPSDARLDRSFRLAVDALGRQAVDTSGWRRGLWKVRVEWTVAGRDYFFEQSLALTPKRPRVDSQSRAARVHLLFSPAKLDRHEDEFAELDECNSGTRPMAASCPPPEAALNAGGG